MEATVGTRQVGAVPDAISDLGELTPGDARIGGRHCELDHLSGVGNNGHVAAGDLYRRRIHTPANRRSASGVMA